MLRKAIHMPVSRTDNRTANLQASFGINKLLRISKKKTTISLPQGDTKCERLLISPVIQ